MAGANPERTSWVPDDFSRVRRIAWAASPKPADPPYIPSKSQIIAAGDYIYVSASDGVHALHYLTGSPAGHYPMAMPPGHSPTVVNGILYVGGYDHKVHAVSAAGGLAGRPLWTFQGQAGFDNNPLVVSGKLYIGGRDGVFYCLDANSGAKLWDYAVGRPLSYSPAYGTDAQGAWVYFADVDGFAYGLNAVNGAVRWKSAQLPGIGFWSFWPVVDGDRVYFAGSSPYAAGMETGLLVEHELKEAWPPANRVLDAPLGTLVAGSTNVWNCDYARNYLLAKPYRRTLFVLNAVTGAEEEVGPFLWNGNEGVDNRQAPMIGGDDGLFYFYGGFLWDPYIPWASMMAWDRSKPAELRTFGRTRYLGPTEAQDKPGAVSGGGHKRYLFANRGNQLWVFDATQSTADVTSLRVTKPNDPKALSFMYGMPPFLDDSHGYRNAAVPFRGRLYLHSFNYVYCYEP